MAQKTAIQQAKDTFNRLTNMKINQAPLPTGQVGNYAVASLPGGRVLLGSGKTKLSAAGKKIEKARRLDQESLAPFNQQQKTRATLGDLLLQIAVPARHMGAGGDKAFTFANYLNSLLRPQLSTAPGLGAPALLPDPRTVSKFYTPSAIANLPPTVRGAESLFQSPLAKRGAFVENTERIQKELAERFLAQFARGERPAAYGVLGGRGRVPLTAGHEKGKFSLPAPKSATAASIRPQTPSFNAATI